MAWVAVDRVGRNLVSEMKPERLGSCWENPDYYENVVYLPEGSVEKLIGRELTWNDEPVNLEEK